MITLRELLAGDRPPVPVWADAAHFAAHRLGADVAAHIRWSDQTDEDDWLHGELAGADGRLQLRHTESEPGAARLEVRVPCPYDPACPHAWDEVFDPADLRSVLAGGEAAGDPQCDHHDPAY